MRLLLDENMSDRRLAAELRAQGHDPVLATDVRLSKGGTGRHLPVTYPATGLIPGGVLPTPCVFA
jgi:hypothetical protein